MTVRLMINGVTIDMPYNASFRVHDGTVTIAEPGKQIAVTRNEVIANTVVEQPTDPARVPSIAKSRVPVPPSQYPPGAMKRLPVDADKLILRFLRQNEGKAYAISISRMFAKHMKRKIDDFPTKSAIHSVLTDMVNVGILTILVQSPMRLYAIAAMQESNHQVNGVPTTEQPTEIHSE
jgi:hypothetical protein